jgi:soluble lytic murein transglycosylase-like protein
MIDLNIRTHGSPNGRLSVTQRLAVRGVAILAGSFVLAGVLGAARRADNTASRFYGTVTLAGLQIASEVLDSVEIEAPARELQRAQALLDYSARFNLDADLTALIYDIAAAERIDPELGFRVVYRESGFNTLAVSSAGALGLAQVMPSTARMFNPNLTDQDLFDAEVNLRIGFRFLRQLVDRYPDDLPLALLAYNRGPARLRQLLEGGLDPRNGYASSVLEGYSPTGTDRLQ